MKTKFEVSYFSVSATNKLTFDGYFTIDDYYKKQTLFLGGEVFIRVWRDEETEEERIVNIKDIRSIKVKYIHDDEDEF